MNAFVDPRTEPAPAEDSPPARETPDPEELAGLHQLCHEGRLYDVERWIQEGRPLQTGVGTPINRRHRLNSALQIALQRGDHALALLLL